MDEDKYEPIGTLPVVGDVIEYPRGSFHGKKFKVTALDENILGPHATCKEGWTFRIAEFESGEYRVLKRKSTHRIYLAGKMSGLPNHNFDTFNHAAKCLRSQGHTVFNPAESFDGKQDLDRAEYFRHDLVELTKCQSIAVLPGWEDSEGALTELMCGLQLGLPIKELRLDEQEWVIGFDVDRNLILDELNLWSERPYGRHYIPSHVTIYKGKGGEAYWIDHKVDGKLYHTSAIMPDWCVSTFDLDYIKGLTNVIEGEEASEVYSKFTSAKRIRDGYTWIERNTEF